MKTAIILLYSIAALLLAVSLIKFYPIMTAGSNQSIESQPTAFYCLLGGVTSAIIGAILQIIYNVIKESRERNEPRGEGI